MPPIASAGIRAIEIYLRWPDKNSFGLRTASGNVISRSKVWKAPEKPPFGEIIRHFPSPTLTIVVVTNRGSLWNNRPVGPAKSWTLFRAMYRFGGEGNRFQIELLDNFPRRCSYAGRKVGESWRKKKKKKRKKKKKKKKKKKRNKGEKNSWQVYHLFPERDG